MSRIWILGAQDPEMVAINQILMEEDEQIVYATLDGQRVHAGNAYYANGTSSPIASDSCCLLVECVVFKLKCSKLHRVGHHVPEEPGWNQKPEHYFDASSIGQVIRLLRSFDKFVEVTTEHMMVAASDHCLSAAYRGECPGVDPDKLMDWRITSRASYQRRSATALMNDVNRARDTLKKQKRVWIRGSDNHRYEVAYFGNTTIPELPEAAAREGIPFIAMVTDAGGRRKYVLSCAPPALVERWIQQMWSWCHEVYGDPMRGFAGAYPEPARRK